MITITELSLSFSGQALFSHVHLKLTAGNCYGVIGANGAGKSTFLKLLSGELAPTTGQVSYDPKLRMSVLKQDHFAYNDYTALETVIMGNARLYAIMQQRDALYQKPDFDEQDGIRVAELEAEFAEMNGYDAETDAQKLLQGLGLPSDVADRPMHALPDAQKVKVLLAQALFGAPDILLLDEPTNHLDIAAVAWLEDFLLDYPGTLVVVSHDRHFLNNVCTHIIDIDYGKVNLYVGNYDFWYESSQLMRRIQREQNRKTEDKIKELQNFIARFSANRSKSRQATSRKKLLDKLTIEQLPASSRKYPFVSFTMERDVGKEILFVEHLCKTIDGVQVLNDVSFRLNKGDKVAFVGESELSATTLLQILAGELAPDAGTYKWGASTSQSYYPKDNAAYFEQGEMSILSWLRQYASDPSESYLRGFLGKMLFSGDDVSKPVRVLSGGEKVRCMLSRMMMFGANVLLLDQPTNHLDLESITAVNNALMDFKGNVLFASHDHQFVQTIANRIIEIRPQGVLDKLMTYDDFLAYKQSQGEPAR